MKGREKNEVSSIGTLKWKIKARSREESGNHSRDIEKILGRSALLLEIGKKEKRGARLKFSWGQHLESKRPRKWPPGNITPGGEKSTANKEERTSFPRRLEHRNQV